MLLYYFTLYHIISYYILYYVILYYNVLLYYIILYHIILYHIILYYIILYYIVLCYIILYYYVILYHIILYYINTQKFHSNQKGWDPFDTQHVPTSRPLVSCGLQGLSRVVYWLNILPISTPCGYHLPPMSPSNPDKMGTWQWINWLSLAASKIEDSKISLSFIRSSMRSSRLGSTGGKWSRILQCQKLAGNLSFLLQRLNYAKWVR